MPWLGVDVYWYGIRSDPRYADLLRRMDLPQLSIPSVKDADDIPILNEAKAEYNEAEVEATVSAKWN